jgi:hypothetical protein
VELKSSNIYNTGGGCMVLYIDVEGVSELRQIGMNEESIVGSKLQYEDDEEGIQPINVCWFTYNWKELIDIVGEIFASDIYSRYKAEWPYESFIKNEEEMQLILCKLSRMLGMNISVKKVWRD